jgi:hypothetical protein
MANGLIIPSLLSHLITDIELRLKLIIVNQGRLQRMALDLGLMMLGVDVLV